MKFKTNRDQLAHALSKVLAAAVSTKAAIPILGNVLLIAEKSGNGSLSLTTTNLDLYVRCKIKAQVDERGGVTLPVKRLASIIKELPNIDVSVTVNSRHEVKIESGGSTFKIMGIDESEFPPVPTAPNGDVQTLEQAALAELLTRAAFAQSADETRYVLNGVYFDLSPGKVSLVATDGRKLAVTWGVGQTAAKGEMILPAKSVAELRRLLGAGKSAKLSMDERRCNFELSTENDEAGLIGEINIYSKVVEGKYPNYKPAIPKETYQRIKLFREAFLQCVARAALVCTEKNNSVKLKLTKNLMEISAESPGVGEAHERMEISYDGPELKIAFNPSYLCEALGVLSKDEIFFELKDEASPGVIKTLDDFIGVIMPVRLD